MLKQTGLTQIFNSLNLSIPSTDRINQNPINRWKATQAIHNKMKFF